MSRRLNRYFSKEGVNALIAHEKMSTTANNIREMQIETTTEYHLIPLRMAIILKKKKVNK